MRRSTPATKRLTTVRPAVTGTRLAPHGQFRQVQLEGQGLRRFPLQPGDVFVETRSRVSSTAAIRTSQRRAGSAGLVGSVWSNTHLPVGSSGGSSKVKIHLLMVVYKQFRGAHRQAEVVFVPDVRR